LYGAVGRRAIHQDNDISVQRRARQLAELQALLSAERLTALVAEGEEVDVADALQLARTELDHILQAEPPA
jgi:hypothetical protein